MKEEIINTDLLIVGGGIAGLMAAIGAKEKGVDTIVVEKAGAIERSGDAAGGLDHFTAYLNEGEPWDTREGFIDASMRMSDGMRGRGLIEALSDEIPSVIKIWEEAGIPLKDPKTQSYYRTKGIGSREAFTINFPGKELKPLLAKKVREMGAKVIERVMVTSLLTKGNRVIGAIGFHVRKGDLYIFKAKAVVIACGDGNRLYQNPSGNPYNCWHNPSNCAGGHVMAYKAGAELSNLEFIGCTLIPKGFSAPGLTAFIGMGCHLVNAMGERFMSRYHPMGEAAPRWALPWAVFMETKEGRSPCYFDCRHLSPKDLDHLTKELLAIDKDTFMDFCNQKGLDLSKDLLEVEVSEKLLISGGSGIPGGININERCASNVEGLYGAGETSNAGGGLQHACPAGYIAGKEAADFSRNIGKTENYDPDQLLKEKERIFASLNREKGIDYKRIETKLQKIMNDYVGFIKNEKGLLVALSEIQSLEPYLSKVKTQNLHELMRLMEVEDLLLVSQLVARASLARKESRFGLSHFRGDYPQKDDKNFRGFFFIKKEEEGVNVSFRPL